MMLAARGQVEEVVGVDLITKYGRRVPHIVFELTGEEDEEKKKKDPWALARYYDMDPVYLKVKYHFVITT